ncbi:fluoride efflux transporter FluC [Kineococcus rhizosphaerae]|uniref:Fluoride-specific ion channel FluC n=1 Tax=Kineococcus rhizosphaerae TaxID=559628 RepID=A0A2T0R2W9_9ACTN|nr:CrcB family protein [Kineococcus rhizosphaerae]PRY14149.1 camphor resistance protein CrcB [Kineococcus rhizosphaerae]
MTVLLALCGGLGAACRFALDGAVRARWPSRFPWGILLVNALGSLLLGFLTGLVAGGADARWRLVLGVGFCGGFTTFSTAMTDTVRLVRERAWRLAAGNLVGTLATTVLAAACGYGIADLL